MKLQFLTPEFHGALDYLAAAALIALPFLLGLGSDSLLALWLSVAGGIGLILYSLLTDYALGVAKLVPYNLHLALDLTAAAAFIAAPFVFEFGTAASIYYPVMAVGVLVVVALSAREAAAVPANA